jgi:hypothetical protein
MRAGPSAAAPTGVARQRLPVAAARRPRAPGSASMWAAPKRIVMDVGTGTDVALAILYAGLNTSSLVRKRFSGSCGFGRRTPVAGLRGILPSRTASCSTSENTRWI